MSKTVLQLIKVYKSNAPLINSMIKPNSADFRTVCCYLTGSRDGHNQMEAVADETIYCQIHKRKAFWTNWSTLRRVAKIIEEKNIDLVVCQFRRAMPIGALAALLSKRRPKVIGVMHGIVGGRISFGRKLVNYFIYKTMSRLVSVSISGIDDIMRMNLALPRGKVVAIQNGIVCDPYLSPPARRRTELFGEHLSGKFLFAMVGRLAPKKNHERVIRALAELKEKYPHAHLVVVGDGPERQRLSGIIEQLGLEERVHFLGYRQDIPDIVKNIDVFLLPSIYEGLPLALMEAMAAGKVVVTSESGGMREIVDSESVGLLVNPHSQRDIELAMAKLLDAGKIELEQLGERAKQRILQQFTAARMAEDYERLYREILY